MNAKGRIIAWFIMIFGGTALSLYLDSVLFYDLSHNLIFRLISLVFGIFLMFTVIRISKTTGRTLAKYGREGDIPRLQTNKLVDKGVYSYMRHPMHLGLLLFPFAWAFVFGLPTFIFIIAPAEAIFMLIMIKFVEEPEAIRKFGDEYLKYMKKTPWFCLKKQCLKALLNPKP